MHPNSNLLRQVFKRLDGAKFHGILKAANEGVTNVRTTYRILFVRNPCFVKPGDLIHANGQKLILMEHPNDSPNESAFKAAYVERSVLWRRLFKTTDPVTGVLKDSGNWIDMGPLHINFDLPESVPVGVLADTRYRFITGQGVAVGDEVDHKLVKVIYKVLGIQLCVAD